MSLLLLFGGETGVVVAAVPVEVPVTLPAPLVSVALVQVDAVPVTVPVSLPAPTLLFGALPVPAVVVSVTIPAPTLAFTPELTVTAPAVEVSVTLPTPAVGVIVHIAAPPIEVPVTLPTAIVTIGTVPSAPPPSRLLVTLDVGGGPVDVTGIVEAGIDWDSTLGAVPTATVTLVDLDDLLAWPLPPGFDPEVETPGSLPVLRIEVVDTGVGLFEGQVVDWVREELFPGMRATLRADGWQRLLDLSPVQPLTSVTATYSTPAGEVVSPAAGFYIGAGDGPPITDIALILDALDWWTGPDLTFDIPYRTATSMTLRPQGAPLSRVLEDIAARLGTDDVWWIDADRCFHWRPGFRGGVTTYTGPSRYVASFHLTDDFTASGGIVPTSVRESATGGHIRRGVYASAQVPAVSAHVINGPEQAGEDVLGVADARYGMGTLLGGSYMYDRRTWKRTVVAVLPPQPGPVPIPSVGEIVAVQYGQTFAARTYFLVRAVRASAVVTGEGIGDIEWTLELGESERRSYVAEQRQVNEVADAAGQVVPVTKLEVGPVSDMGLASVQYVYAWPEDDEGNRIRLATDQISVEWTIWLNDSDIGVGSPAVGWWLDGVDASGRSLIVWTEDQPTGFAYCQLHCDTPAEPGADAVVVTAELVI